MDLNACKLELSSLCYIQHLFFCPFKIFCDRILQKKKQNIYSVKTKTVINERKKEKLRAYEEGMKHAKPK